MEKDNNSLSLLETKLNDLIHRFVEQKGISDSYVQKERDWKKSKLLKNKEIKMLQDRIQKAEANE